MLTAVEEALKQRIPQLLQMIKNETLTLSRLVVWTVNTASELGLIAPGATLHDMRVHTEAVMRQSLALVCNNYAEYASEGDDPSLTYDGMNQLMLNGNHPLGVEYRKIFGELAFESNMPDLAMATRDGSPRVLRWGK